MKSFFKVLGGRKPRDFGGSCCGFGERGGAREQCQCCGEPGAGEADPVAPAARRPHDRALRTPELQRSPRSQSPKRTRRQPQRPASESVCAAPVGPSPGPARSVLAHASGQQKRLTRVSAADCAIGLLRTSTPLLRTPELQRSPPTGIRKKEIGDGGRHPIENRTDPGPR